MEKETAIYKRKAQYYETDQMAIIHHSNYIRWFEEARVYFLDHIGLSYETIEGFGIYSPVLGVTCEYKSSVKFDDEVLIRTRIIFFNGIKMTVSYEICDASTGQLKAKGETKHCFVSKDFKPISLKKYNKDVYDTLMCWTSVDHINN